MSQRLQNLMQKLNKPNRLSKVREQTVLNKSDLHTLIFGEGYKQICSIWDMLYANRQLIHRSHLEEMTVQEQRSCYARLMLVIGKGIQGNSLSELSKLLYLNYALSSFDFTISTKLSLHLLNYSKTLEMFGTTPQHRATLRRAHEFKDIGAYCLTEFEHGSYSRGLLTEAHYDHENKEFMFTTNGTSGMKVWIGGLSDMANMAIVWAQLFIREVSYGPHPFIVEIRDRHTHEVKPKLRIGDFGGKSSGNGVDNGYLIMNNFKSPKNSLLNKLGDIDAEGNYEANGKSIGEIFNLHMRPFSTGRAYFAYSSLSYSLNGLTIALRYAHSRRQFENAAHTQQTLIIDYPLTRFRLIPLIAKTIVYLSGALQLCKLHWQQREEESVSELHALSSALKAKCTWHTSQCLAECRAILGGHGYSLYSRIGTMYQDNEARLSGEGDNYMMLQQACKYLLKAADGRVKSFLADLSFLRRPASVPPKDLSSLAALQTMVQALLIDKCNEAQRRMGELKEGIEQWDYLQPHFGTTLAMLYGDYYLSLVVGRKIEGIKCGHTAKYVRNCVRLWLLQILEQGRYGNYELRRQIQEEIVVLVNAMSDQSVVALDVLAPPEFIIGSPFARFDGQWQQEYMNLIRGSKNAFKREDYYEDIIRIRER